MFDRPPELQAIAEYERLHRRRIMMTPNCWLSNRSTLARPWPRFRCSTTKLFSMHSIGSSAGNPETPTSTVVG